MKVSVNRMVSFNFNSLIWCYSRYLIWASYDFNHLLPVFYIFYWSCFFLWVVGDLHGDLKQARSALEMAGVLSSDGQDLWTGGENVCLLSFKMDRC